MGILGPHYPAQALDISTAWWRRQREHPLISHAGSGRELRGLQHQTERPGTPRDACTRQRATYQSRDISPHNAPLLPLRNELTPAVPGEQEHCAMGSLSTDGAVLL